MYASLCGVGKHHSDRDKKHTFLRAQNINLKSVAAGIVKSKSRYVKVYRHFVTTDKDVQLRLPNQVTLQDLCLPRDFEPHTNVDRRNPIELLNASFIGKAQSYFLWFSFLAAFSRTGIPFQMFWVRREKKWGKEKMGKLIEPAQNRTMIRYSFYFGRLKLVHFRYAIQDRFCAQVYRVLYIKN